LNTYWSLLLSIMFIWDLEENPIIKKKFGGKSIVIVGASSGIGEELVYQLAPYGPKLILAARRKEKLEDIKKTAISKGAGDVTTVQVDVSDRRQCEKLIKDAEVQNGGIDVLFLNAGIGLTSTLFALKDPETLEQVFKVDYFGAMYPAFYALPALRKSRGHIVVTSSVYGKVAGRGVSAYASAKHALHGFFDCLRIEESRNSIQVTLVCPGYINTPIHDKSLDGEGKEVGKHKKSAILARTEISVKDCCKEILRATALGDKQVSFPLVANIIVRVRELIGLELFDRIV